MKMQWKDDPNKSLKQKILDLLVFELAMVNSKMLTIKDLIDSIDEMFKKLIGKNENRPD